MSEDQHVDELVPGGRRRRKRSRVPGCLAVLVALAVIAGGLWWAGNAGLAALRDLVEDPEDFSGPGRGSVVFEVSSGDSSTIICRNLKDEGVVASVDACIAAASANPGSGGIQVGFYELRKEMASEDAFDVLVDPANIVTSSVTIPEGLNTDQIVELLAQGTDFSAQQFQKHLDDPKKIGLPDYAGGEAEGYLFPATYSFGPKAKPADMLATMVDRWRQAADEAGLEEAAERLGYTPHELMTVASLVEAEGRGEDMPKVARVIYNRVENPGNGVTNGLLQIDAAVNYALGKEPIARLTTDQIDSVSDSPYNTYTQPGLPPGPIEAPGDAAIEAAANPADGPWLFYVTVNLATGETKFTESYDEFLSFRDELDEYCATQSDRC
jgi:UPF0755 protein